MLKAEETVLEINLNALKHNLAYLKTKILPETKFLAVVKAFAYGNDSVEIAKYLENQVNYFAVAYTKEGVALRNAGIKTPILVLHSQAVNFEEAIDRCLEPALYSTKILTKFLAIAAKKQQKNYPVHIKFNTGLNRIGFCENDIDFITSKLKNTPEVYVKSIFSHLAASEDLNEKEFSLQQINTFKKIATNFENKMGYKPMLHQLNTSGILNYAEIAQFDMVRSGIGLYGFGNDANYDKFLKPIATLKSVISQIHHIKKGETVGYNRAFTAQNDIKIAILPIGHADGIGRHYGNEKGFVTINEKKAHIIGNVCMDMIMVNISNIDCNEGDEVIIFDGNTTASTFAETASTISYEIITAISPRVKRIFVT